VGFPVRVDVISRDRELHRDARVGVASQLGWRNELAGGRNKPPILRLALWDDRDAGCD
jgi:hypothetical protein